MGQTEQIILVRAVSPTEIGDYFAIREEVFTGEQNVSRERERDAADANALHFLALQGRDPVGTVRVVMKDDGATAKIGRLAVRRAVRGTGVGAAIMASVEQVAEICSCADFALEAQMHAIPFYERLGYVAEGAEYLDAGIPHRLMRKRNEEFRKPKAIQA